MSHERVEAFREMLCGYQLEYIFHEESARKAEKRLHLEGVAEAYVCRVSHHEKFASKRVEAVLRRSIEEMGDCFRPLPASAAFAALETYAANLLLQSWRPEVRQIKLYSGYYKHTVEQHLRNAEVILQLMGYDLCEDQDMLQLNSPVDPDAVINVALDCLVAAAECRMLMFIMEGLKDSGLPLSWRAIYSCRLECSCAPDGAVRNLTQKYTPKSPKHMYTRRHCSEFLPPPPWNPPTVDVHTGLLVDVSSNGTWPQPAPCHTYSPPSTSLADKENVRHLEGSSQGPAAITRSDNSHYRNEGVAHSPYKLKPKRSDVMLPHLVNLSVPDTPYDSMYGAESFLHASYGAGDMGCFYGNSGKDYYYPCNACCTPGMPNVGLPYNYRQHYCKQRSYHNPCDGNSSIDDSHLAKELASVSLSPLLPPAESLVNGHVLLHNEHATTANGASRRSTRRDVCYDVTDADAVTEAAQQYLDAHEPASVAKETAAVSESSRAVTDILPSSSEVWSCGACTFLNDPARDVCEMCSKSRRTGPEMTPLLSGGKQCPVCTLVNDRDARACNVCRTSLKDSPTYI
ncbi:uncharacterized protein LOC135377684 [Ornithodoros turicata]